MTAVSSFDLERYLGEWHQVAAIPAWFQNDCVANTMASYSRAENGRVRVINSCDTKDGTRNQAEARARFSGPPTEGKLDVTFVNILGFWLWPAGGDYWIIGLGDDYSWAVVGQPSRTYAWVLARDRVLDDETLIRIRSILTRQGYDPCALLFTAPDHEGRLCDLTP